MAGKDLKNIKKPIDEVGDFPHPDVLPVKRIDEIEFLKKFGEVVGRLEAWAKVHLKALSYHPDSPTPEPDNFVDDLSHEEVSKTTDQVFVEFPNSKTTHKYRDKPIDFKENFDVNDGDFEEARLLDPSKRKKKGNPFLNVVKSIVNKLKKKGTSESPDKKEKQKEEEDEEEELRLQTERLKTYEELANDFATFLNGEVNRFKKEREEARKTQPVPTPRLRRSERSEWIEEMTQRIHVCHMAFKILGMIRQNCEDLVTVESFGDLGKDQSFTGKVAYILHNRNAYLMIMKMAALTLVHDTEKKLLTSDVFKRCVEEYTKRNPPKILKIMSNKDKKRAVKAMAKNESILPGIDNSPVRKMDNLKMDLEERNLLLDTDYDNISLGELRTIPVPFKRIADADAQLRPGILSPQSSSGYASGSALVGQPETGDTLPKPQDFAGGSRDTLLSPVDPTVPAGPIGEEPKSLDPLNGRSGQQKRAAEEPISRPLPPKVPSIDDEDDDSSGSKGAITKGIKNL